MTDAGCPSPEDPRPWERPGVARRDCAPHRGNVLLLLATVAVLLSVASLCVVLTGWPAFILGAVIRHLADRDLADMGAGKMDPDGRAETEAARERALWGMLCGSFGGMACGLPCLFLLAGLLH